LTPAEQQRVDGWILEQLRLKNGRFRTAPLGLHAMDRAPLDAFAFTEPPKYRDKAEMLWNVACVGNTHNPLPFESGDLIMLTGRVDDLQDRQRWRGRDGDHDYIEEQQKALLAVYDAGKAPGCCVVKTHGLGIDDVVKRVMYLIHMAKYVEFDMNDRLQHFLTKS
jgi:hypothetical protein